MHVAEGIAVFWGHVLIPHLNSCDPRQNEIRAKQPRLCILQDVWPCFEVYKVLVALPESPSFVMDHSL